MALSNSDIQQLIAILQRGLTESDDLENKNKSVKNKKKKNTNIVVDNEDEPESVLKTKSVRISGNKSNKNKFLSMGVKDLHKEDIAIDRALSKSPPTPRTRKFELIDVVCRSCGKRESVSPSLLHDAADRYKCNKCSSSAG